MQDLNTIEGRLDAVKEVVEEEEMFHSIQNGHWPITPSLSQL